MALKVLVYNQYAVHAAGLTLVDDPFRCWQGDGYRDGTEGHEAYSTVFARINDLPTQATVPRRRCYDDRRRAFISDQDADPITTAGESKRCKHAGPTCGTYESCKIHSYPRPGRKWLF